MANPTDNVSEKDVLKMKSNSDDVKASRLRECYGIDVANTYIFFSKILWHEIQKLQNLHFNDDKSYKVETLISKNYVYFHLIGKAFEFLYKTLILTEGNVHSPKHKITILHTELTKTTQKRIEKIVRKHGWNHFEEFLSYLDIYLTNPHRKYFDGFPIMFQVLPAHINERKVLDTQKDRLLEKGARCIATDNGYVDKKRQAAFAETDVLLLTPKTTLAAANRLLGADPLYTATQVATWQAARKTAIEPVFDLLSKLLSITGAHKPLPLRGLAYVSTFLGLGILLLQLAMLMNVRCGLPTRNVTHIKTVFR